MNYTIAAIPTVYAGRQYRSRLEARWAAFFDLLGWRHEYEPYDLGSWSPDFLLTGPEGANVLVEVKPITQYDADVGSKMVGACNARGMSGQITGLLLLGVAPILRGGPAVQIGWYATIGDDGASAWRSMPIGWVKDESEPKLSADLVYVDTAGKGWNGVLSNDCCAGFPEAEMFYGNHTMRLWSEATNAAQWKGPGV